MKTLSELKNLTVNELELELFELRKQQFKLRLKKVNGTLDKHHLVGQIRKAVARVKTIMTQKVGNSND